MEKFDFVAFVDIDGVLNHSKMNCDFVFLEEAVDVLNYLYDKYDIKLVLSSSWRESFTFYTMQEIFKNNNIKAPLIDKTVVYYNDKKYDFNLSDLEKLDDDENYIGEREMEISQWIKLFRPNHFVILDDYKMNDEFLFSHQILTKFWAHDEMDMALRKKHIEKINEIFQIQEFIQEEAIER